MAKFSACLGESLQLHWQQRQKGMRQEPGPTKGKPWVANISNLMATHPTIVPQLNELAETLVSQSEYSGMATKVSNPKPVNDKTNFMADIEQTLLKPLERFMWCLEKLPAWELKVIAYSLNSHWSPWALMCLKTRASQRDVPKEPLLNLIEMATGVPRHTSLAQSYFKDVNDVVVFLKNQSKLFAASVCACGSGASGHSI